jgi:tetratricopeptide (TPR) repeat protein
VARGGWSRTRDFQALAQKLLQRSHSSSFAPAAIQQELAWLLATCPVLELRDGERALSIATGLCERNPRHDENQHARAAAYLELHDYTEAVAAAEMARGDDGHGGDVYEFTLLALANAGLGDTDAANQWQKKALAAYDEQRYPLDQGLRALVQELNMNTRDGS